MYSVWYHCIATAGKLTNAEHSVCTKIILVVLSLFLLYATPAVYNTVITIAYGLQLHNAEKKNNLQKLLPHSMHFLTGVCVCVCDVHACMCMTWVRKQSPCGSWMISVQPILDNQEPFQEHFAKVYRAFDTSTSQNYIPLTLYCRQPPC